MKILRSILAVLVGWLVSAVTIVAVQVINFFLYKPAEAGDFSHPEKMTAWMKALGDEPDKLAEWVKTLPFAAFLLVLISWQLGAFIGGFVSAKIAGRKYLLHAGIVGGLVLAGTIKNFYDFIHKYEYWHPDWMLVAGLLLPLPISLLAGKLATPRTPAPPSPVTKP